MFLDNFADVDNKHEIINLRLHTTNSIVSPSQSFRAQKFSKT